MTIGSRVKAMFACDGKTSVRWELGRVIYLGQRALVEFDKNICGHSGNGIGKHRKCWMMDMDKVRVI